MRNSFLFRLLENFEVKLFVIYAAFAGIATLVDVSILIFLTKFVEIYYFISSAISYLCGMITNYSLNKIFNFKNKSKEIAQQFSLFLNSSLDWINVKSNYHLAFG